MKGLTLPEVEAGSTASNWWGEGTEGARCVCSVMCTHALLFIRLGVVVTTTT